ncbi:hypothetical protein [Flavicella sp.]|uniref:hypothetical protein n=1 Tax=Flavicella sp. TaxID=2957742 RepID=UPI00301A041C
MKKKILFAAPSHFEIYKIIIRNLENLGFEVVYLNTNDESFKYKNNKDRIINLFRKIFLKDKNYKKITLTDRYKTQKNLEQLKSYDKNYFNYSLIIRSDLYPIEVINRIIVLCKKSIAYQWDGLNRYPEVFKRIDFFDKFYIFDNKDFEQYQQTYSNLYLTQNFYPTIEPTLNTKNCDVFYIGTYNEGRFDSFINLYARLSNFDLTFNIMINSDDQNIIKKYQNKDIRFFSKPIMYEENLSLLKSAKIVLDVKVNHHSGLSFRFFEALKYGVKVITDNSTVKEYDFYHPNNIYILNQDNDTPEILERFINSEYSEIDLSTLKKYSFDSWITELLN